MCPAVRAVGPVRLVSGPPGWEHDAMDGNEVNGAARAVGESRPVEYGARIGYAASGLLHLLIGWIALTVAWGRGGTTADQSGALSRLAAQPGGSVLLWISAAGFLLLGLWQLTEAITGAHGSKVSARVKAVGKFVVYVALAWTVFRFASGSGTSSRRQTQDFTASLLQHSGGRLLMGLVGVAILVIGGYHVYKGWAEKFLQDLREHPGRWAVSAGRVGYIAKGIALSIVGVLFMVGAWRRSAKNTTGLDGALRTLREQPLGAWLLTLVALGIACYGIYSFARARYTKV